MVLPLWYNKISQRLMKMGLDDIIYLSIVMIKSQSSGFVLKGYTHSILVQRSDGVFLLETD